VSQLSFEPGSPGVCRRYSIGEAKKIFFSIEPNPSPHYHTTPRGVEKKTGPNYSTSIFTQLAFPHSHSCIREHIRSNWDLVRCLVMLSIFVCLSVLFFPLPGVCRRYSIGEAKKIFFSIGPKPSPHYHTTPRGVEKKTGPNYATLISAQLARGEGNFSDGCHIRSIWAPGDLLAQSKKIYFCPF
jgi:hypothetical protein